MTAAAVRPSRPSLIGRLRADYFSTPLNALISLACIVAIVAIALPLVRWAIINATFSGTSRADCTAGGACWVFIKARSASSCTASIRRPSAGGWTSPRCC